MSDRKPSIHSSRGTIGSAEELDTYGVWVKSEPQDLTAVFGGAGAEDFDGDDLSFGADFHSGFDGFSASGVSDVSMETEAVNTDDYTHEVITDGFEAATDAGREFQEDMPTQILMKMAEEITSIRSELTTLKREFEGSRTESGSLNDIPDMSVTEEGEGFFAGGEDETVTVKDEEVSDTAGFSEDLAFDALREEDEKALRSLSEQTETTEEVLPETEESVTEPFDEANALSLESTGSEDAVFDTSDLGDTAFDTTAFDTFSSETKAPETEETADVLTDGLTDDLEGSSYLEDDPFASVNAEFEDMSLLESAVEGTSVEEDPLDENALNVKLDESDFDFDLSGLSADPVSGTDDEISVEESLESEPAETASIDLSGVEEPSPAETESESFDLGDDVFSEDGGLDVKTDLVTEDSGIAQVIPEAFEVEAEEAATPFDDDLEGIVEEELSADIEETNEPETAPVQAEEAEKEDTTVSGEKEEIPPALKSELKSLFSYMDRLMESLPEEKIEEFARTEYFDTYKKLFKDLDLA